MTFVAALALPVFLFNAIGAHYVGRLLGQASPGLPEMIAVVAARRRRWRSCS